MTSRARSGGRFALHAAVLLSLGSLSWGCRLHDHRAGSADADASASYEPVIVPARSGLLRAGAGRTDLLDGFPGPVPLATYGPLPGEATGVREPVFARALMLDNGEARLGIVSCDLMIIDAGLRAEVVRRLRERSVRVDALLLSAAHTHTSVGGYVDHTPSEFYIMGRYRADVRDHLAEKIVAALESAGAALQPARLGAGRTFVSGLSVNRRIGDTVDPEVGILRVVSARGAPLALVVNFAAHPVLEPADGTVSPDYPGLLARMLDERHGFGLFLGGALGDLNARLEGSEAIWITEGLAEKMAARLFEAVEGAVRDIPTKQHVVLGAAYSDVELPPLNVGLVPDVLFPLDWLTGRLLDWPRRAPVQILRVGDAALIGLSSEAGVRLGLRIKRSSPAPYPFVVTHANGYAGYAVTQVNYAKRKLDATSIPCLNGPRHGRVVVDHACDMLGLLWATRVEPRPGHLSPAATERFRREAGGVAGEVRERLRREAVKEEEEAALVGADATIALSRRRSADFADSLGDRFRVHAGYLYLEELRGGTGAEGRRREVSLELRLRLPADVRLLARTAYVRSDWTAAGAEGADEGIGDLFVAVERPLTLFSSQRTGSALRLIPVAGLSAPTGNPDGDAPIAFAVSTGVWRPSVGGVLEFTWDTYRVLSVRSIYTAGAGRHDGRRPGDRLETAVGWAERHGRVSLFLDLAASLQLVDSRNGGRRPVDVSETSFDLGLRPGLTVHVGERADLFVQGRVPLVRGGSGGGGGVGILAGLTLSY